MDQKSRNAAPTAFAEAAEQDLWSWWEAVAKRDRRLSPGDALFHRGAVVTAMYRIESGSVRLERRTVEGRLLILHVAKPGELLAEASLFAGRYHCDAVAGEPSVVSMCPKGLLLAKLRLDPSKGLEFGSLVSRKLQDARLGLELRNIRSAAGRILAYLELKADPKTRQLLVEGPLQDIASEIGLTREAFYRALSSLERQGAIGRDARLISLPRKI